MRNFISNPLLKRNQIKLKISKKNQRNLPKKIVPTTKRTYVDTSPKRLSENFSMKATIMKSMIYARNIKQTMLRSSVIMQEK